MVRKMFWGRSNFYRSTFQLLIGLITLILGVGGLTGRLSLFQIKASQVLEFPHEQLGDADIIDEGASIQAIVTVSDQDYGFGIEEYVVQNGDTLASIADKFSISEDTIRWANGVTGDYLKVGQKLKILPITGVLYKVTEGDTLATISEKFSASEQDVFDINWLDSKNLKVGQQLLVPNGRMPQPKPKPKPIVTPVSPQPPVPTPQPGDAPIATGNFVRPATCGIITNYFSAWHAGVDIAQSGGCPIIAIDSGVVTMARWYGAGGLQVIIDHQNGYISLYAHHASIYVREGQKVIRGQQIGYMGTTGRSTGVHLHFGLQKNGVWVNPLAYIPI